MAASDISYHQLTEYHPLVSLHPAKAPAHFVALSQKAIERQSIGIVALGRGFYQLDRLASGEIARRQSIPQLSPPPHVWAG
ncbi:unnamed protein product, partial [Iphiclides podalirius]